MKECAIKVYHKKHLTRENQLPYVEREIDILNTLANAKHSVVHLHRTLQDTTNLYFVMAYAKNGNLHSQIAKAGTFSTECVRFYTAEILRGIEYLHDRGIVHRDMKPENILLDDKMHVLIADFGCAKIHKDHGDRPRSSLVGTPEYLSPEVLSKRPTTKLSDIWALGVILYEMVSGMKPFHAPNSYLVFRKIRALEYKIPDGFCELAATLVEQLLVLEPSARLGAWDEHGYPSIRAHPLFKGIDFGNLHRQTPPKIRPYLPETSEQWQCKAVDKVEPRAVNSESMTRAVNTRNIFLDIGKKRTDLAAISSEEFMGRLRVQQAVNRWHKFTDDNLIIKEGYLWVKGRFFSEKRMVLLTSGPGLYIVHPRKMEVRTVISFAPEMRIEAHTFKKFCVHTVSIFSDIGENGVSKIVHLCGFFVCCSRKRNII